MAAAEARVRRHREHVGRLLGGLLAHRLLLRRIDAEAAEFERGGRLADPPFDAAAREEVEHGDALGDARRMVEAGRHQGDAVAEADPERALRAGCQEDPRRRRVRLLLQEVVLDLPDVLDPEAVGELDLLERLREDPPLRIRIPGPGDLVLVEEAELHRSSAPGAAGLYHGLAGPQRLRGPGGRLESRPTRSGPELQWSSAQASEAHRARPCDVEASEARDQARRREAARKARPTARSAPVPGSGTASDSRRTVVKSSKRMQLVAGIVLQRGRKSWLWSSSCISGTCSGINASLNTICCSGGA